MARKHRTFAPGALTHITARGVDGQPIFHTALDCIALLALLRHVSRKIDWQILTWCLMSTHYHLLVAVGRDTRIPWALQTLNSVYARELNARYGRHGHVFGERYADTVVATALHRDAAVAYILENPVRAGLVTCVEDWPWSGGSTLEPRFLPPAPAQAG